MISKNMLDKGIILVNIIQTAEKANLLNKTVCLISGNLPLLNIQVEKRCGACLSL